MNINSKRNDVLMAVSAIVQTQGVEKLTLDAVAKKAGMSKGGLLHHFPTKEALIRGMVEEITDEFFYDVESRVNATDENGKWSRSYLNSTADDLMDGPGISSALTAALFTNPDLLHKLRNRYTVWQQNLENDGIDPVSATIVRLAADGLWFSELFGLGQMNDELRKQVINKLLTMTE